MCKKQGVSELNEDLVDTISRQFISISRTIQFKYWKAVHILDSQPAANIPEFKKVPSHQYITVFVRNGLGNINIS